MVLLALVGRWRRPMVLLHHNPANGRALRALQKTSNKNNPLEALQPTSSQARRTIQEDQKANKKVDLFLLCTGLGW